MVPPAKIVYTVRERRYTHVCMYPAGNNVDFHAPAGSPSEIRRRTSNEPDEV